MPKVRKRELHFKWLKIEIDHSVVLRITEVFEILKKTATTQQYYEMFETLLPLQLALC